MNLQKAWIGALFIVVCGVNASGHEGKPHNWHDLSRSWSLEPAVVIGLLLSAALFARGVHYLWRESGTGRGAFGDGVETRSALSERCLAE